MLLKPPPRTPFDRTDPAAAGLIGAWLLNDEDGGPVNAVTGAAGTQGGGAWGTGPWGPCLDFVTNGGGTGLAQPSTSIAALTMAARFRPASFPVSEGFVFYNGTDGAGIGMVSGGIGGPGNEFNVLFGGVAWHGSGYFFPAAGVWYDIAITYVNASGQLAYYVDGDQVNVLTVSPPAGIVAGACGIGSQPAGVANRTLLGSVDRALYWNRALDPATVRAVRNDPWFGHPRPSVRRFSHSAGGAFGALAAYRRRRAG